MKINNLIYVLLFALVCFITGCEDDDSLFSGDENYITSFRLIEGEHVYAGCIVGDSLVLSIPESVSLENVEVEFTASENATLSPDPASIDDWGKERTFTVTSYNQASRSYKYIVIRTLVAQAGDVVLTTPEEIETFAARGINKIEGNLVIGKPLGTVKEDSLVSLAPLSSLKEVAGRVTINPTFAGVSLDGLQNLESVGGFTMLARASEYGAYGLRDLKEMVLPNLRKVGSDLVISADTLYSVDLRALESVGGSFTIETRDVRSMDLSALQVIAGKFSFSGRNGNMLFPERLELPKLGMVGDKVELNNPIRMKELLFPALTSAAGITLQQTGVLEKVDFSQLREVAETLTLQWTHRVKEYDLSQLQSVGGFRVYYIEDLEKINLHQLSRVGTGGFTIEVCNKLNDLDLAALTEVQGNFVLSAPADLNALKEVGGNLTFSANTENFDGFNSLTSVGGNFALSGTAKEVNGFKALTTIKGSMTLNNMNNVTCVNGFDALRSIGSGLSISNMEKVEEFPFLANLQGAQFAQCSFSRLPALQGLDISVFSTSKLMIDNVGADFVLRGNSELDGEVTLNSSRGVRFDGIEKVQTLTVTGFTQKESAVFNFTGLKQVDKLTVNLGYVTENAAALCFPDLEEVTGLLTLSEGSYGNFKQIEPVQLPVLRKVGALTYTGVIPVLELPALESVEGEFRVSTSYQNGPVRMLEEIRMPNLKNVGGLVLTSNAYSADNYNNLITDLSCFSALESAGYVNIQKQAALVSFEGLEKVINKLEGEDSWTVSENAYNPTFEQVKAGELVK